MVDPVHKKRTLASSGCVDTQAALSNLFRPPPDANNPRSNVSDHGIRESLGRIFEQPVPFLVPGNHLAYDPPVGTVVVYTH